jgi:hypothetical protein
MPVKVWVGRFAIVDGQPQEEGPLLRSFPRQRPDEDEDELYVLVEPVAEGNKEYYGQLVDAIGRMYQQDTLSITGAVLRAMQASHRQLRDWNDRTLREQRVAAGTTCLAVRSRTAYLAQLGPSVAYHVGDGRFQRVAPEPSAAEPLGLAEYAEPTFNRFELAPGDLLLIASTSIERVADEDTLRSILLRGGDDALVELFRIARDQPEFSLVLLACVVEPEDAPHIEDAPPLLDSPPEPFIAPAADVSAPPPDVVAPAAQTVADALELPRYQAPGPPPLVEPQLAAGPPPSGATAVSISAEDALVMAPPAGYTQPKVRLKGAEADVHYRRSTGVAAMLPKISPIAVAIALIMIIAGLLAWQVIPRALQDSKEERFRSRVQLAESSLTAALATTDTAKKRDLLQTAQGALQDAERKKPGDQQVRDLNGRVEAALNELNAVLVLPDLEQVVDISGRIAGPVSSKDLALGGGGAYFLDRDQGRVIAVSLLVPGPRPFELYKEGELVGTEITSKAHSIAWAEQLGSLLIMDDERRLISVAPPSPGQDAVVRAADAWGSEDGIGYLDGSLHVLDRNGDQVWRYPASQDGFDSEREGVLPTFDLDKVVEMAAGDPLYLLFSDGSIVRFAGGVAQPFSQAGIDRPMSSPGSIVPLPALGMVLVADRGNARIVIFSPDGAFKQQLVSPKFTDLRAIAVDEAGRQLYILNGGALYRTPLPTLP